MHAFVRAPLVVEFLGASEREHQKLSQVIEIDAAFGKEIEQRPHGVADRDLIADAAPEKGKAAHRIANPDHPALPRASHSTKL